MVIISCALFRKPSSAPQLPTYASVLSSLSFGLSTLNLPTWSLMCHGGLCPPPPPHNGVYRDPSFLTACWAAYVVKSECTSALVCFSLFLPRPHYLSHWDSPQPCYLIEPAPPPQPPRLEVTLYVCMLSLESSLSISTVNPPSCLLGLHWLSAILVRVHPIRERGAYFCVFRASLFFLCFIRFSRWTSYRFVLLCFFVCSFDSVDGIFSKV